MLKYKPGGCSVLPPSSFDLAGGWGAPMMRALSSAKVSTWTRWPPCWNPMACMYVPAPTTRPSLMDSTAQPCNNLCCDSYGIPGICSPWKKKWLPSKA
eukprot:jgi/Botrbrau1/4340/Bobra.0232s0029.1